MIGAEAVESAIARFGTRAVFSLSGAQHSLLLDVLERAGYRIVGNRSESAVVAGADGYARITGRPGIALVISGQGIVNAVAGVATAFEAGSPVVVLMARPPHEQDEPRDAPYYASTAVVAPVAKWHVEVARPDQLFGAVTAALELALSGRPGPVVVGIPADFLGAEVQVPPPWPAPSHPRPRPSAAEVEQVAAMLAAAERPVVIAGNGVRRAQAEELLGRLAGELRLPVLLEGGARGSLAEDGEQVYSWALAQTALQPADLVLVLGCRLSRRLGGGLPPRFSPAARIVQVDLDPAESGRGRPVEVAVIADLRAFLDDLLAARAVAGPGGHWIAEGIEARRARLAAIPDAGEGGLHPIAVARRLSAGLEGPAIVAGDGADSLNWTLAGLSLPAGSSWIDHRLLGSMGICLPLALGAAVGEAERAGKGHRRPVVLVTGDGALGYHLVELETAARCGIDLRVVVCNDGAWGTERNGQLLHLGRSVNTELTRARYDIAAEGLGSEGMLVTTPAELDAAIKRVLAGPGPVLVNVTIDQASGLARKTDPIVEMIFHSDFAIRSAQQR